MTGWEKFAVDAMYHLEQWGDSMRITFGLGGGVGLVKLLNHWPAPYEDSQYGGTIFDWLQDLVSNKRIGERRTRAGALVSPVAVMDPNTGPEQAADTITGSEAKTETQ